MKPKNYGLVSNSFPFDKAGFCRIKKTSGLVRAYSAIVNDFTSDGLKKGIEWLANEVDKNHSISKNANIKILNFEPRIIAQKYVKIYNELI